MTNSTSCTHYEDDLKAYADNELSWLRRQIVRRHLTHCASCQKEIVEMTQITEDLRAAESDAALSSTLREKILQAPGSNIATGAGHFSPSRPTSPLPGKPRKRPVLIWGLVSVALVAWFICVPIYERNLVFTKYADRSVLSETASAPTYATRMPTPNASKQMPPSVQVPSPQSLPAPPPPAMAAPRAVSAGGSALAVIAPDDTADTLRQVHKEASIGVQVPNPEATGDTINAMVQETGGYVAANNLTTGDNGLKSGELIVKVPVTQFETFLAQVAKLGTVQSKNISGEDITEKTSDAREAQSVQESDLEQSEARLKALGSKAKWQDQENTRDLRIQLAQTRARLKLLKRMAELGTITIDLSQTPKAVTAPALTNGFTGTLKATTHDALQSLVGSASALLALVIWLLAYAPIWIPLALLGRYALKEYRKREVA